MDRIIENYGYVKVKLFYRGRWGSGRVTTVAVLDRAARRYNWAVRFGSGQYVGAVDIYGAQSLSGPRRLEGYVIYGPAGALASVTL